MLQITRQGNSIVVKGLDHALYPYSGTLEIPCNSVITVVDESDIVTFRSASNYDVLFSGLVTQITINGETVTKENVGDKFGALSNVNSGGLTPEQEEKLNNAVQISDYNADKEAQATIDENQNSAIEGLRGNIEGKQDKIDDLNTIREGAEKGATALQTETDPVWTAEKGNYYDKGEIDGMFAQADATYQPKGDYATKGEVATEVGNKQDTLISGTTIKTINGESILGSGNVQVGGAVDSVNGKTGAVVLTAEELGAATTRDLEGYYTKVETDDLVGNVRTTAEGASSVASTAQSKADEALAKLDSKADKSEIPSLDGYATEQWVEGKGYLTEHQDISGKLDKTEATSTYQPKGNYATKDEIPSLEGYATEEWVNSKGYLTEHQDISGKQDVITDLDDIRDGAALGKTALQSFTETDPTVPAHVKAITEEDIAKWNQGGYDVYQWSFYPYSYAEKNVGFEFKKNGRTITGSEGYIVKYKRYSKTGEIDNLYENASSESFLFEIPLTDDTIFIVARLDEGSRTRLDFSFDVVSNIKGGGITEETDPVWTAEKVNYYTKSEVDEMIGNINNALATLING